MFAKYDLITWSTRWRLQNNLVACKTCGASQREADKGLAFEHQPGCGYAGQGSSPWEDLETVLAVFRRDKL